MPRDVYNKEIRINRKKIMKSQEPFHPIFFKRTYRMLFKKGKQNFFSKDYSYSF